MQKIIKVITLVFVCMVLCFPMIQSTFKLFPERYNLHGSFAISRDTVLNSDTWFEKVYQEKQESYLNENFGFRNFLVKLNNQIDFSVYDDFHVNDVFKGKNDYLFSYGFYRGYSGKSFKGDYYTDSIFQKIGELNARLIKKNKKLLVCFTPCKESFMPEFLPDTCYKKIGEKSYYNNYRKKLIASKIPFLDYNSYFQQIKKTAPYPLFTQGAVHWTTYGAYLALDSLLKRIPAELNKNTNLIRFKSVQLSDSAMFSDDDISKAMNLLMNVNSEKLAYPSIEYVYHNDSCYKPKVLIIGDSFYYGLNNTWIPMQFFSKESFFLYYYRTAISYNAGIPDVSVSDLNLTKELENTDIVILFFSIGTLQGFPYGATDLVNNL